MPNQREKVEKKAAEEAVRVVSNYVNSFSNDARPFVEAMSVEHRTLQQCFTNICMAWFRHLASLEPHRYDGRNEASVLVAREIVPLLDEATNGAKRLPCI